MSLVTEVMREISAEQQRQAPDDAALSGGELPLFAAAEQISRQQQKQSSLLRRNAWLLLGLLIAGLALGSYYRWQIPVANNDMPAASTGFAAVPARVERAGVEQAATEDFSLQQSGRGAVSRAADVGADVGADVEHVAETPDVQALPVKEPVMAVAEQPVVATPVVATAASAELATVIVSQSPVPTEASPAIVARPALSIAAVDRAGVPAVPDSAPSASSPAAASDVTGREVASTEFAGTHVASAEIAVKQARPLSPEAQDRQVHVEAKRLLTSGLRRTAVDYLAAQLSAGRALPDSAALYTSLLLEGGEFGKTARLLAAYRKQFPTELDFVKLEIRLALAKRDYNAALALLDDYALPVERDADFTEYRALALQSLGDYQGAGKAYRELLAYDARPARWWMGLAVALDASAEPHAARDAYQRALQAEGLRGDLNQYAQQRLAQL